MELHITMVVLCAAIFHATWNSLIKGGKDTLLDSMLLSSVWLIISITAFPFLPLPHENSWPFLGVSVFVHVSYLFLLANSYHNGELSRVYPIIRGLPPLIVSLVGFFILKEDMSIYGWLGVFAISIGILTLEIGNKTPSHKVLILSLATASMIATYTVIDGIGARLSGNSTSFLMWQSLFQAIIFITLVSLIRNKKRCLAHARMHWQRGVIGGILSIAAYGIVLWAMTQAPIAYVSALRETSVLFASIIAVLFLSEPLKTSRIVSAILIISGIVIMKIF